MRLSFLLLALPLAACSLFSDGSAEGCPAAERTVRVEYFGGAMGYGDLQLAPAKGDRTHLNVSLKLVRGMGAGEVLLAVAGPGTCKHGIVRARFGGGDVPSTKVLGGTVEVVLQPELFPSALFGGWTADVVVKETGERRKIQGFIQAARPDAAPAPASSTGTPPVPVPSVVAPPR